MQQRPARALNYVYAEFGRDNTSDLLASQRVIEDVARAELGVRMFTEDRGHFRG